MLRAVTDGTDDGAERYAHAPNKHLRGRSVLQLANAWFGRRAVERFLLDLGRYLGIEEVEDHRASFGRRR